MSRWTILLLVTYVGLGLSPLGASKATRIALVLTALVVSAVVVNIGVHG